MYWTISFGLLIGGLYALNRGFKLVLSGRGRKREENKIEALGLKATVGSIGSLVMITAFLWGWAASYTLPNYKDRYVEIAALKEKENQIKALETELDVKNVMLSSVNKQERVLESVRAKGYISVGVRANLAGFSELDKGGNWHGLDVDTARAVAAAVFGTPDSVKFVPVTRRTNILALQSGEIDLLISKAAQTLTRETNYGLNFVQANYFDGQGFLVPKKLGITNAKELSGAKVCVLPGTTTEFNAENYFSNIGIKTQMVAVDSYPELEKAYFAGRCDCLTSDATQLASLRARAPNPEDHIVLPDIISPEPLGPAVRQGDYQWADIVKFATMALIQAEYYGITSKNIDSMVQSKDPKIQRFLGVVPGNGQALGLDEKWAYNIVKMVGNYAEIFERNVGASTPLKLERGKNALWINGGLMYAPAFE